MNNYLLIILVTIILTTLFCVKKSYLQKNKIENYESKMNFKTRNMSLTYSSNFNKFNPILTHIVKKYNINKVDDEWNIYLFATYKYIERDLNNIKLSNSNQYIFGIKGCDKIVSKNSLWTIVSNHYGSRHTSTMLPRSYIITNKSDIQDFIKDYNENNIYLLKKNVQRKEGILLTRDKNKILKIAKNINNKVSKVSKGKSGIRYYKLIQLYIQDLYLINNRKCNIRLYILIKAKDNIKTAYLYKHGKCLYTNSDYNSTLSNNTELVKEEHLTSYNLDTNIYNYNPQTLLELKQFIGVREYKFLWNNIIILFKKVYKAIKSKICNSLLLESATCFQIFGADIIFTNKMKPYLLEFNKGPSMQTINSIDKNMKIKLYEDVFKKVGILASNNQINEFIKI